MTREVRIALIAALALLGAALGAVAVKHPDALARTSGAVPTFRLGRIGSRAEICQAGQLIPQGTTALVAFLAAYSGPSVSARITAGGRVLATGHRGSGWTSRSVTISLSRAVPRTAGATVCFEVAPRYEVVEPRGGEVKGSPYMTVNGKKLPATMTIEYLRPGDSTWLSRLPTIARHMGLGRIPSGHWAPVLATLLVVAIAGIVTVTVAGRPR
jgi:hypothetical protein